MLLIADEPTTALDVTIQAQILDLMRELRAKTGTAIILITHDLGVVAEMADRVGVMYAGEIVEEAAADNRFDEPLHPDTQGLMASIPVLGLVEDRSVLSPDRCRNLIDLPAGAAFTPLSRPPRASAGVLHPGGAASGGACPGSRGRSLVVRERGSAPGRRCPRFDLRRQIRMTTPAPARPLVEVENLVKHFPVRGGVLQRVIDWVQAVDGVNFTIREERRSAWWGSRDAERRPSAALIACVSSSRPAGRCGSMERTSCA